MLFTGKSQPSLKSHFGKLEVIEHVITTMFIIMW